MIKSYIYSLFLLFIFTLSSCTSEPEESTTYFGGKIINPKSEFVTLHSQDKIIDSFIVNKKGMFIGKIDNLSEGLYYFTHGNENQQIYLEPKDSLMLRLNTWDFDESLVFSGKGSERNNILLDCFLDAERERRLFFDLYKLSPDKFISEVDILLKEKMETYNNYVITHPKETSRYNEILKVALTYPIYSNCERFPIMNAKMNTKDEFPKLLDSFYDFRKNVHINNDSLMYFPPYAKYVRNYLYNETYALGHSPSSTSYSSAFTNDLLKTIDKKIVSEESKNAFLKQTVINHFYNKSSCNINEDTFNKFYELSSNNDDIKHIKELVSDTKYITANKEIHNFAITDFLDKSHSIKKIIKRKNSFVFFWNPEYVSENFIASRMSYLKNKYKNIQFIQVNMNSRKPTRIQNLDIKEQYYLKESSEAHHFLTSKMPRAILIDNKGKVVNGFASISSRNLYPYLQKLNK